MSSASSSSSSVLEEIPIQQEVIAGVYFGVNTFTSILLGILLIWRRNRQPVKARSPMLAGLALSSSWFYTAVYSWRFIILKDNHPCWLYMFLLIMIFPWNFSHILLRAFRLFFIFRYNKLKVLFRVFQEESEKEKNGSHSNSANRLSLRRLSSWNLTELKDNDSAPPNITNTAAAAADNQHSATRFQFYRWKCSQWVSSLWCFWFCLPLVPRLFCLNPEQEERLEHHEQPNNAITSPRPGQSSSSDSDKPNTEPPSSPSAAQPSSSSLISSSSSSSSERKKRDSKAKRIALLKKLTSDWSLFQMFLTLMALHGLIYIVYIGAQPDARSMVKCFTGDLIVGVVIFAIEIIVYAILFIPLILSVWRIEDAFNMRFEALTTSGVILLHIVAYLVLWLIPQTRSNEYYPIGFLFCNAMILENVAANLPPVLKTFKSSAPKYTSADEAVQDVMKLREISTLKTKLYEFCKLEFSTENMDFLDRLDDYNELSDEIQKLRKANRIFRDFVASGAPLELNITSDIRRDLRHGIRTLRFRLTASDSSAPVDDLNSGESDSAAGDPEAMNNVTFDNLFDDAQRMVIANLLDTIHRFKATNDYEQAINELRDKEELLKESNLV